MNPVEATVRRVDAFQQRHSRLALAFGVVKKFGDDRAGALAALIAYYGFLALFPLLLFLTTILGFVVGHNPGAERAVLHSALRDFPIIGNQLVNSIQPLRGNAVGLAVGLGASIWGALGVTQAGQLAMAEIWNVPGVVRPNFVTRTVRGFGLFAVLGLGVLSSTVLAAVSSFGGASVGFKAAAAVGSLGLNVVLYALAAFSVAALSAEMIRGQPEKVSVAGAVEDGAPRLELADPVGSLLCVKLGHPRVVQQLPADHRVPEVDLPAVAVVDMAHRGGDAALSHDGVSLAQEGLAHDKHAGAAFSSSDRAAQAGATRSEDEHVGLHRLVRGAHETHLGSCSTPASRRRM